MAFQTGKKHPNWGGGRFKAANGYVFIYMPDHPKAKNGRYVYEHRLVMEEKIGRYLARWEIIHHRNGVRDDNRIENLILSPNQSEHWAVTRLIEENKRLKEEIKSLKNMVREK